MKKIADNITEFIGQTPLIKLNQVVENGMAHIYLKLESFNAGGSVKDRIALQMIEDAEKSGQLKAEDTLVEASSGNTGIGISFVAAAKGYKVKIFMPESMSIERRRLMQAYGAELELTSAEGGMKEAIAKADDLAKQEGYVKLSQFENLSNPKVHEKTTGPEIYEALDQQTPDAFVAGVGTGGTITGAGSFLKDKNSAMEIVAVEADDSAVLSGEPSGSHKIQGISAGFIPEVLDTDIYQSIERITNDEAIEMTRRLAAEEGILVGISSGAAVAAALKVARRLGSGKRVVAVAPDTGERYLSTVAFDQEK
ncbi:MAG: cysteine synthase A [Atopococcus tabaci]|uniref:Cysteine synthase n=1 Tax=Atopococcus tabaci TaxID=269774 RepID=A0AA43UBY0_9LACT|nr:cysteine synthase A [Atopococcus tabaci]